MPRRERMTAADVQGAWAIVPTPAIRGAESWAAAKALSDEMAKTFGPLLPNGSFKEFSMYNIPLEKERMNAAGWMTAGPSRPPYDVVPPAYLEGARASGRLWAELARRCDGGASR